MSTYPQKKLDPKWIREGIKDETIEWAKSFGEFLQKDDIRNHGSGPLTSSQIRKFFGELKRIQADPIKYGEDIPLLKAKLAYAVGRDANRSGGKLVYKSKIKEFYEELETGINAVRPKEKTDINNFVKIVEAIVAYHKYYGGK
ncbi:MAG: type III-A CRISPR-associated protein Csm2 [Bacteroidales bacterium]|jgi:CRISPR type III-A-associated protein Csm2|nr:type III-A CRISPR-associated protein Csm2 [Bacteroidales bacterium]